MLANRTRAGGAQWLLGRNLQKPNSTKRTRYGTASENCPPTHPTQKALKMVAIDARASGSDRLGHADEAVAVEEFPAKLIFGWID